MSSTTQFVARHVTRGAVVVAAVHPDIGPVYWTFIDESDVNAPDYYGLTTEIADAHRFHPGHVTYATFKSEILRCNTSPQGDSETACGDFDSIAREAGLDPESLLSWFLRAKWLECQAPPVTRFIADFNGFVGYRPVWTENLHEAARFSQHEIDSNVDPDISIARAVAEFVPLDAVDSESSVASDSSNISLVATV